MIAKLRAGHRLTRIRCVADDWSFDPRYTQGRCPICGWQPEGVPTAPRWLALVHRVDWDMVGLFALVDMLFLLALVVAHAAGLITGHPSFSVPSSHGGTGAASATR